MSKANGPSVLGVAVAAAAVGAVVALLFAPKSGKETREELLEQADHMKRRAVKGAHLAQEVASEAGERFHEAFGEVAKDAKRVARTTKSAAHHAAGSVKDAAVDVEDKARDAWGRATK